MTIRERLRLAEASGSAPLAARLQLLDALSLAPAREREFAAGHYGGGLRVRKLAESREYWREFWELLRHTLESGDVRSAVARLDAAVDRVEPR